jgi:hypothetical protein
MLYRAESFNCILEIFQLYSYRFCRLQEVGSEEASCQGTAGKALGI